MNDENKLCIECSKKSFCETLCPEAELYVSQDEAPATELPVGGEIMDRRLKKVNWSTLKETMPNLTKDELRLFRYIKLGLQTVEIAKLFGIKQPSAVEKIKKLNEKIGGGL